MLNKRIEPKYLPSIITRRAVDVVVEVEAGRRRLSRKGRRTSRRNRVPLRRTCRQNVLTGHAEDLATIPFGALMVVAVIKLRQRVGYITRTRRWKNGHGQSVISAWFWLATNLRRGWVNKNMRATTS
jgi:hypothetical protein